MRWQKVESSLATLISDHGLPDQFQLLAKRWYWPLARHLVDNQSSIHLLGINGAQGYKGLTGDPGPKGSRGPQGYQGLQGKNGTTSFISETVFFNTGHFVTFQNGLVTNTGGSGLKPRM